MISFVFTKRHKNQCNGKVLCIHTKALNNKKIFFKHLITTLMLMYVQTCSIIKTCAHKSNLFSYPSLCIYNIQLMLFIATFKEDPCVCMFLE